MSSKTSKYIKSPLKWAGGKRNISEIIVRWIEEYNKTTKINQFIEPFCGGLSVTLHLASVGNIINIQNYWCNDINRSLVHFYTQLIENPTNFIKTLEILNDEKNNCAENYYQIRDDFNQEKTNSVLTMEHAAKFLYLNKRNFNGLYRENSQGLYNVPYRKNNSSMFEMEHLISVGNLLSEKKINFTCEHYTFVLDELLRIPTEDCPGTIVYIDPPYYPIDGKSSFTQYHSKGFDKKDQEELAGYIKKLDTRKIPFILSNVPCEEIYLLYKEFFIYKFHSIRDMRNAEGKTRANSHEYNEVLITNMSTAFTWFSKNS